MPNAMFVSRVSERGSTLRPHMQASRQPVVVRMSGRLDVKNDVDARTLRD